MAYNVLGPSNFPTPESTDISNWIKNYKEQFLNQPHDSSQMSLVLPDDSLVVIGPPRLRQAGIDSELSSAAGNFYIVGFLNTLSYNETRGVQPLKGIGSRRHIFAATNAPVQGQIGRLLFLGTNLYRAMYMVQEVAQKLQDGNRNSRYAMGSGHDTASWLTNAEDDIFRLPFGLGIIYHSPATMAGDNSNSAGAEYIEVCTITSKQITMQSGQAMVMEQVSFMADRILPWKSFPSMDVKTDGAHAAHTAVYGGGGGGGSGNKSPIYTV